MSLGLFDSSCIGCGAASALRQIGAALWRTLEAMGRSRARRELFILADQWELTRPDLAQQLREAADSPDQG